jgi:hypothetical protein
MCGRYVNPATAEAERYFAVHLIRWQFDRSYNIAPTQQVPVVRLTDGQREGLMMRWGLVPPFAKGVPPKYSTINATIESSPMAQPSHLNSDLGQHHVEETSATRHARRSTTASNTRSELRRRSDRDYLNDTNPLL